MQVIPPDFDRLTDLPGVGEVPCPVDIDRAATGFSQLTSFRVHDFPDGATVEDGTGAEEVIVVLLAGALSLTVSGPYEAAIQLDADGDWAACLPPDYRYALRALLPATVAIAHAPALGAAAPLAARPVHGVLALDGSALRLRLLPLEGEADASAGLGNGAERFVHLTGPARVAWQALPPMHTLALAPGEDARVVGEGELLVVAATGAAAAAP